jgi:tetratricopeptide (TPR) repeat protein
MSRLFIFWVILMLTSCTLDPVDQRSPYDMKKKVPPVVEKRAEPAATIYVPKGQLPESESSSSVYSEETVTSSSTDSDVEHYSEDPMVDEADSDPVSAGGLRADTIDFAPADDQSLALRSSSGSEDQFSSDSSVEKKQIDQNSSELKKESLRTAPMDASSAKSSGKGAETFIAMSDKQLRTGQFVQAAASAERAVRLNPHSPAAYYQLARVRFEQGKFVQSEQLAHKAISYAEAAGSSRRLLRDAWSLVARCLSQQGKSAAAERAREKAAEFE